MFIIQRCALNNICLLIGSGWEQELKAKPFRYYGMTLRVEEIPPCTSIQVTVYDKDGIDRDALLGRGLTTNPDNLSSVNIEEIKDGDKWIYIMHYRSAEGESLQMTQLIGDANYLPGCVHLVLQLIHRNTHLSVFVSC